VTRWFPDPWDDYFWPYYHHARHAKLLGFRFRRRRRSTMPPVPSPASITIQVNQSENAQLVGLQPDPQNPGGFIPGLLDAGSIVCTNQPDPTIMGAITLDALGNFAIKPVAVGVATAQFTATANGTLLTATLTATFSQIPEGFATSLGFVFGTPA